MILSERIEKLNKSLKEGDDTLAIVSSEDEAKKLATQARQDFGNKIVIKKTAKGWQVIAVDMSDEEFKKFAKKNPDYVRDWGIESLKEKLEKLHKSLKEGIEWLEGEVVRLTKLGKTEKEIHKLFDDEYSPEYVSKAIDNALGESLKEGAEDDYEDGYQTGKIAKEDGRPPMPSSSKTKSWKDGYGDGWNDGVMPGGKKPGQAPSDFKGRGQEPSQDKRKEALTAEESSAIYAARKFLSQAEDAIADVSVIEELTYYTQFQDSIEGAYTALNSISKHLASLKKESLSKKVDGHKITTFKYEGRWYFEIDGRQPQSGTEGDDTAADALETGEHYLSQGWELESESLKEKVHKEHDETESKLHGRIKDLHEHIVKKYQLGDKVECKEADKNANR